MAVTRDVVEEVARLARLRLSDDEIARMTAELNGILEHIEDLGEADVEGVEGVGGVAEAGAPAADESGADPLALPPADIAPAWQDDFFTVPKLAALGGADDE